MASRRSRALIDRACKKPKLSAQTLGYTPPQVRGTTNPQPIPVPAPVRPAQVFRLEPEIMYMIMAKLDIFTARVWGLTCRQFNEEYKKNCEAYVGAAELLQTADRPRVHLPKVLPLNTRCELLDGTSTTLIRCISSTMPPHLSWNPFTGKMASAAAIQDTVYNIEANIDKARRRLREAQEAAEERSEERREAKRLRRINIANKMECKRQLLRAEAEENGEDFDSDDVSEEDFSDGPVSDWDEDMEDHMDEEMEYL
ncbi:hypothetical protein DL98DRAFT_528821 [Cadophora sp. DSE1049]|nr:hypothetical protein DL98DRAFT_528821 [Cadophora sp. DSE1049]